MTGYILASELIAEIGATSSAFAALTSAQQLEFINAAIGEFAVMSLNQGKDDYRVNTISGTALPTSAVTTKSKHFTANASGEPHTFTQPFTVPFSFYVWGVKNGSPVQVSQYDENGVDSLTASGFTAYPAEDGTEVYYIATPEN